MPLTYVEQDHLGETQIVDQVIVLDSVLGKLGRGKSFVRHDKGATYEVHPFEQVKEEEVDVRHVPLGYIAPYRLSIRLSPSDLNGVTWHSPVYLLWPRSRGISHDLSTPCSQTDCRR